MTTLTLRNTKGSPLTNTELDANFTALDSAKEDKTAPGAVGNILTSTGTAWYSAPPAPGGITFSKHTANITAVDKQGIIADTTSGTFTVTLPATPSTGTQVVIADGNDWGTNSLIVARNSSTIEDLAENLTLDIKGAYVTFIYDGTTWEIFVQIGANGGTAVTLTDTQTLSNKTFTSLTNSGNLTFTGTGNRITGDFSNATVANRVIFQSSTTNGATDLIALPNGTGTRTGFIAYGGTDPVNSNNFQLTNLSGTDARLTSGALGTGTFLPMTFYTGGSERVRVDTSGNVGIGTASPVGKLDVLGADDTVVTFRNTTATIRLRPYVPSYTTSQIAAVNATGSAYTPLAISGSYTSIESNGVEQLRVDTSGNVNIGTVATNYGGLVSIARSQISSSANFISLRDNGSGGVFNISSYGDPAAGTAFQINYSGVYLSFRQSNTERLRIDPNGDVNIGGTTLVSPARLDITKGATAGSVATQRQLRIAIDGSANYSMFLGYGQPVAGQALRGNIQVFDNGLGSDLLLNPSGGNVGVGTSSPTGKLTVNGSIQQTGVVASTTKLVKGLVATVSTITVDVTGGVDTASYFVEISVGGYIGVYLKYIHSVYKTNTWQDYGAAVVQNIASAGVSVAYSSPAIGTLRYTITATTTYPVVSVEVTSGGNSNPSTVISIT